MPAGSLAIILAHAVVGWGLCGAAMGIGLATTSLRRALVIHGVAAPMIFALVAAVYFTQFGYTSALVTATWFVAVAAGLDLVVVAGLIQRRLDMFRSVWGTWLPLAAIFGITYLVGQLAGA